MFELTPNVIIIGSSILGGLLILLTLFTVISRFYRRCGADEALVRTGAGGNKVIIGGGILVYPILHELLRVSLRSVKLSVERSGKNALVTGDKIKANVVTELYIKVEPLEEDVLAAARSFGERNLDEHAIADLIDGKLTDALRSVAANQTFMLLHSNRKQFAERIQETLSEELKKNGLTLENVSITALAMLNVKELDPNDVFDAEGLRAITESVQTNREKTNQIQREKENQIQAQNVTARMRQLELEQTQKHAEADQARRVSEYQATQAAENAKVVYVQEQAREIAELEKQRAVEAAQIGRQKIVMAAEIDKQKVVEAAGIDKEKVIEAAVIDKEKTIEVARIAKVIAITQSEEAQARAAAAKALALAEEETARQAITMVEVTALANRGKASAVIAAQTRVEAAEREAEATVILASAIARKAEAEAEARRKMLDAENRIATKLLFRDVALKALEVAPDLARELMAPAHAIKEIRVLQSGSGAQGPMGAASPILKTILEAGAAYPMMRELLQFGGGDLAEKAKALLDSAASEIKVEEVKEEPVEKEDLEHAAE